MSKIPRRRPFLAGKRRRGCPQELAVLSSQHRDDYNFGIPVPSLEKALLLFLVPGVPEEFHRCRSVPRVVVVGIALTMVSYVLPLAMVEVRAYLDRSGRSPFAAWSDRLNREAAAKLAAALARIQQGNLSNAKGVGAGVYEYRIDFGPGYRIYFGKDGDRLVILVGGGTKKR